MTYGVIIIMKTFYMSSRSNGENFISIRQADAEKITKVLYGQTNKQTNRQTNVPKCNILSFGESKKITIRTKVLFVCVIYLKILPRKTNGGHVIRMV